MLTDKRMETCMPKSPMLKQVWQLCLNYHQILTLSVPLVIILCLVAVHVRCSWHDILSRHRYRNEQRAWYHNLISTTTTIVIENIFLAYHIRFSTSAVKSYLSYPYPTHGMDEKQIITCQYIGCIGGHVTLLLGVDFIETSHTASIINMTDVGV